MTEKNSGTGGEHNGNREDEIPEGKKSDFSFLDSVEDLAMRQRDALQQDSANQSPDLQDLSS